MSTTLDQTVAPFDVKLENVQRAYTFETRHPGLYHPVEGRIEINSTSNPENIVVLMYGFDQRLTPRIRQWMPPAEYVGKVSGYVATPQCVRSDTNFALDVLQSFADAAFEKIRTEENS